jgi:hypothetical protein
MTYDESTPTIPVGHVPTGDQYDGTTPKYLAGFRAAVKAMMGPKPHQWSATYGEPARIEQLLRQAYQRGLLDGYALVTPVDAPGPVNTGAEVPRLTLEEVWADLGLFEVVPGTTPQRLSDVTAPVLPPMNGGGPRVWATRIAMEHLGMSLAEASEWAKEMTA